jgi:hypothetical protein
MNITNALQANTKFIFFFFSCIHQQVSRQKPISTAKMFRHYAHDCLGIKAFKNTPNRIKYESVTFSRNRRY